MNTSTPPLRIAQVHTGLHWGGGEEQVFRLHRGLCEAGLSSTLFSSEGSALYIRAGEESLPVQTLKNLPAVCELESIQLLHAHDSKSLALASRTARNMGVPLIYHRRIASPLRRNIFSRKKYSVKNITRVIAISETVKRVFMESGYPADRICVIPSSLDLEAVALVKANQKLKVDFPADYLVGGFGTLSPKKNWPLMINAAAQLQSQPLNLQWFLYGEGKEKNELKRLIDEHKLTDCFHLMGFTSDAWSTMKAMDVLCMPSIREGASITVREAMALGIPVASAPAEGSMESLDGQGWVIPDFNDAEAMSQVILDILTDPESRKKKTDSALQSARERFDLNRMVERTANVYREVVKPD